MAGIHYEKTIVNNTIMELIDILDVLCCRCCCSRHVCISMVKYMYILCSHSDRQTDCCNVSLCFFVLNYASNLKLLQDIHNNYNYVYISILPWVRTSWNKNTSSLWWTKLYKYGGENCVVWVQMLHWLCRLGNSRKCFPRKTCHWYFWPLQKCFPTFLTMSSW